MGLSRLSRLSRHESQSVSEAVSIASVFGSQSVSQ